MSKNQSRCQEEVNHGDAWHHRPGPCGKPAGHGENGLYCKIHARRHPAADNIRPAWVVDASASKVRVLRVEVVSGDSATCLFRTLPVNNSYTERLKANQSLHGSFREACEAAAKKCDDKAAEAKKKADEHDLQATQFRLKIQTHDADGHPRHCSGLSPHGSMCQRTGDCARYTGTSHPFSEHLLKNGATQCELYSLPDSATTEAVHPMTVEEIQNTAWARRAKDVCPPSTYDEAIALATDAEGTFTVVFNDEAGKWQWSIVSDVSPGFWMDAQPTKGEALDVCRNMGWTVSKVVQ